MPSQMEQANAGDDEMGAPSEFSQHPLCVFAVARLAKNAAAQTHLGIRADDQRIRETLSDDAGFAIGVEQTRFDGGKLFRLKLLGVAGDDLKFLHDLAQQLRATRRGGGENDGRKVHGTAGVTDEEGSSAA